MGICFDFKSLKMVKKNSIKAKWQDVKLNGNLLTDDSVGTLEGFIGLEVLENYDKSMVIDRPHWQQK